MVVEAAVLSHRYISDRFQPDKAIDVLDEAGARVHLQNIVVPKGITELEEEIKAVQSKKEKVVRSQNFEQAAILRDEEKSLQKSLENLKEEWNDAQEESYAPVSEEDVAAVISMMTGIPVTRVAQSESEKLLEMPNTLKSRIIGQDPVIDLLSKAIQRTRAGLKDPNRPIGSFIFLGPTGVGKTTSIFQSAPEKIGYIATEPRNPTPSIEACGRDVDVDIIQYTVWPDLMEFLNTPSMTDPYATIVVDSLTHLMNIGLSAEIEDESF